MRWDRVELSHYNNGVPFAQNDRGVVVPFDCHPEQAFFAQ
jgi:hypothetical protein